MATCKQCGVGIAVYDICLTCEIDNRVDSRKMDDLFQKGHKLHCAHRMTYGDGECECGYNEDAIEASNGGSL